MKTIATLAFGIACAVGASLGVASVASVVVTEPQRSERQTLGAPDLWTMTPVKIDRAAKAFERLPPVLSTYASTSVRITKTASAADRTIELLTTASGELPTLSGEHLDWCASRYRSFNAETNTYRSFSGETKTCASPFESQKSASDKYVDQPAQFSSTTVSMAAWCAARYQSYRIEDNTYQPYCGQRRPCRGPKAGDEMALR